MTARARRALIAACFGVWQGFGAGAAGLGGARTARAAPADSDPLVEMKSPDVAPLPHEYLPDAPAPDAAADEEAETALEADAADAAAAEAPAAAGSAPAPRPTATMFGGYVDFGFFVPSGDGAGWIADTGANRYFPQYASQFNWIFLGDIMAPAINTRGEPADLGDAPGVVRHDTIDSNGALGFIVNEVNLNANAAVLSNVLATTSVNLTPRTGSSFSWGDTFDVDIAQLEWLVGASQRTSVFVGKFDSRDRHRVPRAQGEPAVRHHPDVAGPLHHRHAARPQGADQAR